MVDAAFASSICGALRVAVIIYAADPAKLQDYMHYDEFTLLECDGNNAPAVTSWQPSKH